MKPVINSSEEGFFESRPFDDWDKLKFRTVEGEKLTLIPNIDALPSMEGQAAVWISQKFDGKSIRIFVQNGVVRFLTSGGLDFYHNDLARMLLAGNDGCYFCELIYDKGQLGTRTKLGYLTTAVDQYTKEKKSCGDWFLDDLNLSFKLFDFLPYDVATDEYAIDKTYTQRFTARIETLSAVIYADKNIEDLLQGVFGFYTANNDQARRVIATLFEQNNDMEGVVIHKNDLPFRESKRQKHYKIKFIKESTGTCYDIEYNKHYQTGALLLNDNGFDVRVSSGINDQIRMIDKALLYGASVEYEYEYRTEDGATSQARLKRITSKEGKQLY